MPWGRYPGRVKDFQKWAQGHVQNSNLSDSATPHGSRHRKTRNNRRWRLRRSRKKKDA